jgi:fluoride exporter
MMMPSAALSYTVVAIGGAIGSVARFAMVNALSADQLDRITLATMAVNIVGSTLIGLIAALTSDKVLLQHFLIVGVLGGYTTFSAFSGQSFRLIMEQRWGFAAVVILGSVLLCLLGTWMGSVVGRSILGSDAVR